MDSNQNLAQLNPEEQRVLGSLIEKSRTTPDYYPMSINGPQTPGELNTNSGRLYEFETIEEVQNTLHDLSKRGFVKALERRPGQKEVRYVHLLGDSVEDTTDYQSGINPSSAGQLNARVEILEKELSELKDAFNKLLSELT